MIRVNMHQAKTRLSELVKTVEERGAVVVLCRDGVAVAEIRRHPKRRGNRLAIRPDPALRVEFAPGYDPAEPLSAAEWPEEDR